MGTRYLRTSWGCSAWSWRSVVAEALTKVFWPSRSRLGQMKLSVPLACVGGARRPWGLSPRGGLVAMEGGRGGGGGDQFLSGRGSKSEGLRVTEGLLAG